ncbi:MAG: DUF4038 domain-containing protein [Kiritimatiellae bacterium]|nr:DUF4038 domain-containing protein [Kiritimatiellia bacterium]
MPSQPTLDAGAPQLRISPNRRHLVDAEGRPFFLMGDTPWFLQKLRIDDVRHLLEDRRAKGFNALFLELLDDSRIPSRDGYGNPAFETDTDITRPVESYWQYAGLGVGVQGLVITARYPVYRGAVTKEATANDGKGRDEEDRDARGALQPRTAATPLRTVGAAGGGSSPAPPAMGRRGTGLDGGDRL